MSFNNYIKKITDPSIPLQKRISTVSHAIEQIAPERGYYTKIKSAISAKYGLDQNQPDDGTLQNIAADLINLRKKILDKHEAYVNTRLNHKRTASQFGNKEDLSDYRHEIDTVVEEFFK